LKKQSNVIFSTNIDIHSVDAHANKIIINRNDDEKSSKYAINYKNIILACGLGQVKVEKSNVFRPDKQSTELPISKKDIQFRYTKYWACCIEMNQLPPNISWSAIFEKPNHKKDLQVMSFCNLISTLPNCILAYVRCENYDDQMTNNTKTAIINEIENEIDFFNKFNCQVKEILHSEYFGQTMPVLNENCYQHIQNIQGQEHIYYAGQFFSSFPSLESACFTGRLAAHTILNTGEQFLEKSQKKDMEKIAMFQNKTFT
jgi:hypothetical protein